MEYKVGTWSPSDAVLPQIDTNCKFAQFYITESGKIDGLNIDFVEGSWLIYIKENNKDNWFQANGTVVVNTTQNNLFPPAGFYTKIQLDSTGHIVGTDQLTEKDLPAHTHVANDIKDFEKQIVKEVFDHLQDDQFSPLEFRYSKELNCITISLKVDETTIGINKFGQLEARGFSGEGSPQPEVDYSIIIEKLQPLTEKIESLEKQIIEATIHTNMESGLKVNKTEDGTLLFANVDGDSVIINQLGQISINPDALSEYLNGGGSAGCANHTHEIGQIEGLEEYIDDKFLNVSFKPSADWVDEQTIIINENGQLTVVSSSVVEHKHTISDIEDFPHEYMIFASDQFFKNIDFSNGKWDLTSVSIGGAVKALNENALEIENRLIEVEKVAGKVVPAEPYNIDKTNFYYEVIDPIEVMSALTERKVEAGTGFTVESEMIYPLKGELSLILDNNVHHTWSLNDEAPGYGLVFTYKGDFYELDKNYQNFFQGFKFRFSLNGIEEGSHTVNFKHTFDGKSYISKGLTFNTYSQPEGGYIAKSKIHDLVNDKIISGVPCYSAPQKFKIEPFVENFIKNEFFPVDFVKYKDEPLKILKIREKTIYYHPIEVDLPLGENQVSIEYDIYNFLGTKINSHISTSKKVLYNSTTVEQTYRVAPRNFRQTRIPKNNPDLSFTSWNSTWELFQQQIECYIINDIAYSTPRSFADTGGPIYNTDFGETINGEIYKWVELKIPNALKVKSIEMSFKDESGNFLPVKKDGSIDGVYAYLGFAYKDRLPENYIDCQKYYTPWTKINGRDFGGLDLYKSNNEKRSFTLGSTDFNTESCDLYVLLAIKNSLDLKTIVDTILESFNKNKY